MKVICILLGLMICFTEVRAEVTITDSLRELSITEHNATFGASAPNNLDVSRYWIKVPIKSSALYESFYLECQSPNWSDILVVIERDSFNYVFPVTGAQYTFDTRPLDHKNFLFPLPQQNKQYCIWIGLNDSQISEFSVMIRSNKDLIKYSLSEYFLLGFYYGLLILVALYNTLLYLKGKLKLHLFYVLYIIGCIFLSFREDGIAYHFVWPSWPKMNYFLVTFVAKPLFLVTFLLYATAFLNLHKLHKAAKPLMISTVLIYLGVYLLTRSVAKLHWISESIFVITFLAVYVSAIYKMIHGDRFARYFFIGFSLVLMSMLVNLFRHFTWIAPNILTVYSYNYAIIAEVILFSFALAEQIRYIQDEKRKNQEELILQLHKNDQLQKSLIDELDEKRILQDKVNRELEQKVKERTIELQDANDRLQLFAQKLDEMNSALDIHNHQLKKEIKEEKVSRIFHEEMSYEQFVKIYPTEEACVKEIYDMKWANGFTCKKCNNDKFTKTQAWHKRKCTKCGYIESVTSHTLYHHLKFPLTKAFYITYLEVSGHKYSNEALASMVDLRKPTVWAFRQKIGERFNEKKFKKIKSWKGMILD